MCGFFFRSSDQQFYLRIQMVFGRDIDMQRGKKKIS